MTLFVSPLVRRVGLIRLEVPMIMGGRSVSHYWEGGGYRELLSLRQRYADWL